MRGAKRGAYVSPVSLSSQISVGFLPGLAGVWVLVVGWFCVSVVFLFGEICLHNQFQLLTGYVSALQEKKEKEPGCSDIGVATVTKILPFFNPLFAHHHDCVGRGG